MPKAHRFFTEYHKKPVNKPLLSNLIRYHALEYLWTQGFDAKEEEGDGWGIRGLPNNGIELLYRKSCIRVRKGIDPPYPTTNASEEFYQQRLFDEMDHGVITNLLVLYNLDRELQYDKSLRLMRPYRLNSKRKLVKCEWSRTVQFNTVDLNRPVPSEYMHERDLPLGGHQDQPQRRERTGTDDKPNNAD